MIASLSPICMVKDCAMDVNFSLEPRLSSNFLSLAV